MYIPQVISHLLSLSPSVIPSTLLLNLTPDDVKTMMKQLVEDTILPYQVLYIHTTLEQLPYLVINRMRYCTSCKNEKQITSQN